MAPLSGGPKKFADLGCLAKETVAVLTSLGFQTTTPVQEATIPLFCGHKDVAVDACTGSGKTLAFVLPVIERLRKLEEPLSKHQTGAIVISPTRELAKQIYGVAEPFVASVPNLTSMLLVGGTDPAQDVAAFKARGAHVLIGTPGRIEDILKRCTGMDLRRLEVLVLDEADRLLDMGFKAQLDAVMARLPKQRRTGLFSATQTEAVQELARAGLRNPVRVNVAVSAGPPAARPRPPTSGSDPDVGQGGAAQGAKRRKVKGEADDRAEGQQAAGAAEGGGGAAAAAAEDGAQQKTPNSLSIEYITCEADEKIAQLVRFLHLYGSSHKVIVYALTCAAVDHLALVLPRLPGTRGVRMRALHGRMKQAARERELEAFRALPAGALLCTDLAARGLDIPDVHWIVQLDPPQDPSSFVHRVGRTARMGRSGRALVLLQPHEEAYVEFLRLRKVPLTEGIQLQPTSLQPPAGKATSRDDQDTDPPAEHAPGTAGQQAAADHDPPAAPEPGDGQPSTSGRAGGGAEADEGDTDGGSKAKKKKRKKAVEGSGAKGSANAAGAAAGAAGAGPAAAPTSTSVSEVLSALRRAAERDREVMEAATKAFVTYVRAYKEHHCKFIFRLQDLNVGRLARGLGLLRLPKLPDLKRPQGLEHFTPSEVDPSTVPYKDKAREKQRLKALQQRQEAAAAKAGGGAAPGGKRKGPAAAAAAAAAEAPRLPAAKRRQLQQIDEAANLNAEYRLLKKLKKGKISEHQYDVATGLSSDSEERDDGAREGGTAAAAVAVRQGAHNGAAAEHLAGDPPGSGGSDDDDSDVSDGGGGGRGGGGKGGEAAGGGAGGGARMASGSGRAGGSRGRGRARGQQPGLAVKQQRGALQSYIDKKAKKKKKTKSRQQQQQH